jgi:hypothetical protein
LLGLRQNVRLSVARTCSKDPQVFVVHNGQTHTGGADIAFYVCALPKLQPGIGSAAVRLCRWMERRVERHLGLESEATENTEYDRDLRKHPPLPFHVYKVFVQCDLLEKNPMSNAECTTAAFFPEGKLPELSLTRVTEAEIAQMFEHLHDPSLPADLDWAQGVLCGTAILPMTPSRARCPCHPPQDFSSLLTREWVYSARGLIN